MKQDASPESLLEQDLRREIQRGRVVVVVGSGVSVAATGNRPVASWMGLLEDGVSRCEQLFLTLPEGWGNEQRAKLRSGDAEELLAVADEVARALGAPTDGEYRRWLRETVGELTASHRDVIAALEDLEVPIATTNYDSLIEEATGLDPVTWRDDARMARVLRKDEAGILHLHGHWEDPESVVLGIRSYEDVLGDARAQFMQQAITAFNSLLFVGCGEGLQDPNLRALRRWLVQFAGWEYRHFRLALQSEARAVAGEHEPAEHIAVVVYGKRHDDLAPFLRKLRPPGRPASEPEQGVVARLRGRRILAAAGAVALAVVAVLGILLFLDSGTPSSTLAAIPIGYAGTQEIGGSGESDVYTFSGKGETVSLVSQPVEGRCPEFGSIGWKLTHEASGETVFDQSMGCEQPLGPFGFSLKGGQYRLTVYGDDGATGAYRFTVLPITEQQFSIEIGDTVRKGVPSAGAGEIADPGQLDVYTFSGKGETVSLVSQPVEGRCPEFGSIGWKLTHEASGETVFDQSMGCEQPLGPFGFSLKGGQYRLTVYGDDGATGAYRFTVLPITEQQFSIEIGDTVRKGVPSAGAGEIADPGQLDVYTFSGKGETVSLVSQPVEGRCPEFGSIGWKLTHEASGETVFDQSMGCNEPLGEEGSRLKRGSYTLAVYGEEGATSEYRFALRSP